jgi:hypothetical protein
VNPSLVRLNMPPPRPAIRCCVDPFFVDCCDYTILKSWRSSVSLYFVFERYRSGSVTQDRITGILYTYTMVVLVGIFGIVAQFRIFVVLCVK